MIRLSRSFGAPLTLCILSGAFVPVVAAQQEESATASIVDLCTGGIAELEGACIDAVREARAVQSALGLMMLGGTPVPGSPGTVGRRLERSPRVSISARTQLVRAPLPEAATEVGAGDRNSTAHLAGGDVALAVGIFDGFFLAPTLGGILSVDLLAGGHLLGLSDRHDFDRWRMGYSAGARIGVIRESFTLPGIAVSGRYASVGTVTRGRVLDSELPRTELDLSATSVRATIGREFRALGFLGGAGWDRYRSEPVVRLASPGGGGLDGARDVRDRTVYFGGISLTHLILQLSGEVGWSPGREDSFRAEPGDFDPTRAGMFGSLALRLTF